MAFVERNGQDCGLGGCGELAVDGPAVLTLDDDPFDELCRVGPDLVRRHHDTFHKEHHLFPTICHVNYPAMSKVVEQTCRDFGVEYKQHSSFGAGLAAHYRWLKRLGSAD